MLRQFQRPLANPTLVNTVAVASVKQATTISACVERHTRESAVRRVRISRVVAACLGLARNAWRLLLY